MPGDILRALDGIMRLQRVVGITTADGEQHAVTQERHPRRSYGAQFVIVFTRAMQEAARQISSSVTARLLMVLPAHLNFTDFRQVRNTELAADLGTHAGNISRSMRELLALGILEREGRGPRTAWRLSSDWGWSGTADQWHAHRAGRLRGKRPPAGKPLGTTGSRIMQIMESRPCAS